MAKELGHRPSRREPGDYYSLLGVQVLCNTVLERAVDPPASLPFSAQGHGMVPHLNRGLGMQHGSIGPSRPAKHMLTCTHTPWPARP